MVDPATHLHRRDASTLEPDVRLLPGTILEGRTVVGAARCSVPTATRRHDRRARRASMRQTGRPASARSATACDVGPYAYLRPGTRLAAGRARRHVRRDEERRDRRGRQGAAPLVRRRRRHRRAHATSARARSPRTTTGARSTAPGSASDVRIGLEHRRSSRRSRWATAPTPVRGLGREPRRAARRARQGRARAIDEGWAERRGQCSDDDAASTED